MIERVRPTPDPCPFCEAAGLALQDFKTGRWWVKCRECQAQGPNQPDQYRAIIRWNRRPRERQIRDTLAQATIGGGR